MFCLCVLERERGKWFILIFLFCFSLFYFLYHIYIYFYKLHNGMRPLIFPIIVSLKKRKKSTFSVFDLKFHLLYIPSGFCLPLAHLLAQNRWQMRKHKQWQVRNNEGWGTQACQRIFGSFFLCVCVSAFAFPFFIIIIFHTWNKRKSEVRGWKLRL